MITGLPLAAVGTLPAADAARTVPAQQVDSFQDALQRRMADQATPQQAAPGGVPAVAPAEADPAAKARARQGLGLDGMEGQAPVAEPGDMILDGLQKLRGVFDARQARVSQLMSSSSIDAKTLMAVQMEVTNFTLLVDISSKLTGKTTQALDTLMKGQ